jgi:hypothetical protein
MSCTLRRTRWATFASAVLLLLLYSYNIKPRFIAKLLGGSPRSPSGSALLAAAPDAVLDAKRRKAASLVWVLLGDPHFQPYLLESVRQARIFNKEELFFLVVDPHFFQWNHTWVPSLQKYKVRARARANGLPRAPNARDALPPPRPDPPPLPHPSRNQVVLVNYTTLQDPFVHDFEKNYQRLWDELGRKLGAMMQPTINGKSNMDFTQVTMTRVVAVHQMMLVFGVERVVHIENDQMLYGSIQRVAAAAEACGVRLALTRLGVRMSYATMFARDAAALKHMLDFILDAISHGVEHAIKVVDTKWVTDMSLPAAYFQQRATAGDEWAATFPHEPDTSCLAESSGFMFDALPLGAWCCGSFEKPRKHLSVKMEESETKYWKGDFQWRVVQDSEAGGKRVRRPFWNGAPVFNLHMHSKQLQLWRSDELEFPEAAFKLVKERN